ncbi:TerC family protein [Paenibacillus hunanensis]|uniref:YjbE family integral membrane protein n=1 Tax=Paenibacillus hunanensis TaxID=539262 RepID=A0ABU1J2M0_9BACL|nr:TerC family protein [Paenibacillus hunanensis]MDR6245759.1 YjbE family integral membrane protein [Paenibacillus hunanensis]GGJ19515.1 membrane protein [Paenibacillus hunanensis]
MDITQPAFWLSLLNIIFIDLILAGDNAIVIGLAARKLPQQTQKKAILYGMGGAVIIRIAATVAVIWLLQIPWLLAVGGLLLIAIAYKLLTDNEDHKEVKAGTSLWSAVWTIIIADAAMGLDNVIAVAGAANQHVVLVIIGLCISVPIVVWGSTIFIKLTNRFSWIIYVGSAVLAYTASHMITQESRLQSVFGAHPLWTWIFIAFVMIGVLLAGYLKNRQTTSETSE